MDLTNDEIKVLLEIIDNISIPVKQAREIVQPIVNKLQVQLMQNQTPIQENQKEVIKK